jgi:hypothetical protein
VVVEDPGALDALPEKARERLLQTLLEGRLKRFTSDVRPPPSCLGHMQVICCARGPRVHALYVFLSPATHAASRFHIWGLHAACHRSVEPGNGIQ